MKYFFILNIIFILGCSTNDTKVIKGSESKRLSHDFIDGKAVFQANCATCHNILKDETGPPLRKIMKQHSTERLFKFLTRKNKLAESDTVLKRMVKYDVEPHCPEFFSLSLKEVEALHNYVIGCTFK